MKFEKSRAALAVIAMLCMGATKPAAKPPSVVKRAVKPAAKVKSTPAPSPTAMMVTAVHLNSIPNENVNLFSACAYSNFKQLAVAMNRVKGLGQSKGEFETEQEFSARVASLNEAINNGRQTIVCQSLANNKDAPFQYDADSEIFKGSFNRTLRADLDYKDLPSYIGKTRMGISFRITRSIEIDYNADMQSIPRSDTSCRKAGFSDITYQIPVPRVEAPAVKQGAHLVIWGSLQPPYVTQDDSNPTPSLDEPYDDFTRTITVTLVPVKFAIVMPGGNRLFECSLE